MPYIVEYETNAATVTTSANREIARRIHLMLDENKELQKLIKLKELLKK